MKSNSIKVKIGDFLKRIKRPIGLEDDKEYKLVTIKLHHNGVTLRGMKKGSEIKSKMYEVRAGDFILSGIDARNGAFGIVPEELDGAIVTNDFWYFNIDEEIIEKHFFLELTATEWFDEICKKGSDGTTQRIRLQKDKFFDQTINLPDRSEQDELLAIFKSRKKLTEKLSARISNNLELIPLLRQQILQDAITGKLSEKWRKENPDIESAEALLEKIKTEKEKLVKEGKIRKQKPLPPITENEILFALPEGWVWCRLGEIILDDTGGGTPSKSKSEYWIPEIPWASVKDIASDMMYLETTQDAISKMGLENSSSNLIKKGSVIIVTRMGLGKIAFNNIDVAINQDLRALYFSENFESHYFYYFYKTLTFEKRGMTVNGITKDILYSRLFPLPPLAEQHYIVERIESLLAKIDRIKELNIENQANIGLLNQVVLKEMFEE